ncbi:hypothetical protein [Actinomadura sp. NTSP31]|uniref:hypothetical protein n=1 Tax=Actinomadura sp. NTSP31 TaxID=1735447 RepID=UPI0035BFD691
MLLWAEVSFRSRALEGIRYHLRVPASERTRRELFTRGGGRCAMCQRSLVIDVGPGGAGYHIAEAAHIVAEAVDGPRGNGVRPADVNGIANLVLLCPSDHRTIDKGDGARLWPPRKLLKLKRDHESWTAVLASRPPLRPSGGESPARTPPGPGDVVVVDGESYRLCGVPGAVRDVEGHADGAYEVTAEGDGSVIWCQGHAYGEGGTEGHAWLRRSEAAPGEGVLRAALADEAALLLDLPSLPGLPRLLGVDMTAEAVTLVTALPSPKTFRDRCIRTGLLPGRDELALLAGALRPLCEALGQLHDRGSAHRALSPGTLVMPALDTIMLRDLGLASTPPRVGERDDPYHAPEQAAGTVLPGPPTDVHRLARVLYELVTGRPPGRRARHVAPSTLNPAVPAEWDAAFRDALAVDPAQRSDVRGFAAALRTGTHAAIRAPGSRER